MNDLKEKTVSSIIWKGMERVCAQLVSTIVSIVLARLLMPDDYSVVSIVAIFFSFCNLFISGGLNSALIQKKDADKLDYSTILTANLVMATVLYFVMFFTAPTIARLYEKEILVPVIRVMALSFFINAYKAVICAKISSDLKFKKFFISTIIGTVISAVIGISMAMSGYGAWALVAQQMSNSLIDAIILTVSVRFAVSLRFSFARFKGLLSYGGRLLLAYFITTVYNELKPLVVGVKYSTNDLAYYNKGRNFPSLINTSISSTLSAVLFPAMSKLQDDPAAICKVVRRYFRVCSFVMFPMLFGFAAISDDFIRVVLTEKWMPISPYIKVFCIAYMLDIIQIGNVQAFQALGRSDISLKLEVIKKTIYFIIVALFIAFSNNPILLAASEILCYIVATVVNIFPNKKLIGYQYKYLLSDLVPNAGISVIMCIPVYALGFLQINVLLLLFIQVLCGVAIYLGINFFIKNESLYYLLDLIKTMLPHRKGEST